MPTSSQYTIFVLFLVVLLVMLGSIFGFTVSLGRINYYLWNKKRKRFHKIFGKSARVMFFRVYNWTPSEFGQTLKATMTYYFNKEDYEDPFIRDKKRNAKLSLSLMLTSALLLLIISYYMVTSPATFY